MRNRRVRAIVLALCGLSVAGCRDRSSERPSAASVPLVRVIHTWAVDASMTAQMQAALARSLTNMRVEVSKTDVSGTALLMLQRGDVDAVFTFASFAYMALNGQLAEISEPSDNLRAIAELPARPVQVVVGPHSGITSIGGLRGRRVSIGPPGSNAALIAQILLQAFGISLQDVNAQRLELRNATQRILTGELDAVFSNVYANPDINEAVRRGARILEIDGAEVDRSRARYPLMKPAVIPAGTHPTVPHSIHTVGIDEILVCRTDLDERVIHELTSAFVDMVARRELGLEPLKYMNLGAASSTAIPLHPGAARYYRERELLP